MKQGWQMKTLGDVCAFDKAQGIHRGLPYVGLEDVEPHTARFIGSNEPQTVKSSTFRFSNEHVLYGRLRPYLNKALAPDFEGHCSTEIFPLKPSRELSREYLLYWLLADETCERINATCTGARMPRAQMNEVMAFDFPLAPLAEQRRIVGLLDEAFEGLATAKANADQNLHNARTVFESHLHRVFTQRGPGWVQKPLGDFCSFENGDRGTNYPSKSSRTATGIPFINAGHLTDDGIDIETMDYISRERFNLLSNGKIRHGDILFCLRGSLGKVASVGNLSEGAIASSLVIVRPGGAVLSDFLLAYFRSALCVAMIDRYKNGAAQPNLSAQSLRSFVAPVPSLAEQKSVVEQLTALRKETWHLGLLYERKLAALEALKKSLLHQAFTGNL